MGTGGPLQRQPGSLRYRMPTYEYRCPKGHTFELFQKMSEEPRAECPECGLESERLLSGGAGFLFKGEGFYITDYRSEAYKKAASGESSGGGEEKGGEKKGEKEPPKKGQAGKEKKPPEGKPGNAASSSPPPPKEKN